MEAFELIKCHHGEIIAFKYNFDKNYLITAGCQDKTVKLLELTKN